MAKQTDKKTSNLIIAGGYCLVAIIILVNYLNETSRNRQFKKVARKPGIEASEKGQYAFLQRQLEEEKKVNREMRSLLRQIQERSSNNGKNQQSVSTLKNADNILPELKLDLLKGLSKSRKSPFIPGKNPFAPSSMHLQTKPSAPGKQVEFFTFDPDLPFLISGADENAIYLGN
ncbi:MAG: hypothetical protein ACQETH_01805 [Candidatus Rifleibacteriota bacterium]